MSDQQTTQDSPTIQQLREAAERGNQAEREAAAAKRELALVRAGVDLDTPIGAMFARAYDGALESDAIKAAWAEVAPAPSAGNEEPPPPAENLEGQAETEARRTLTGAGANDVPPPAAPEDPVKRGYEEFQQRLEAGESRERASGSVFGSLIQAAAAGDKRAIWEGWTEEQLGR